MNPQHEDESLTQDDLRMLLHGLKSYRRDLGKKARRNEETGWTPQPGHGNRVDAQMRRWDITHAKIIRLLRAAEAEPPKGERQCMSAKTENLTSGCEVNRPLIRKRTEPGVSR